MSFKWQLILTESNRVLAGICLTYLLSVKFHSELDYGSLVAPYKSLQSHTSPHNPVTDATIAENLLIYLTPRFPTDQYHKALRAGSELMRDDHFVGHTAKYVLGYIDYSGPDAWDQDKLGKLALDMFTDGDACISWLVISESTEVRRLVPPLKYAASAGMTHLVEGLLELGHDPVKTNHEGQSALMIAVRKGWIRIVELLLQAGAACGKDDGHSTALHLAVQADNFAMVDVLLRYGADRLARSLTDAIPLHLARSAGIAEMLLKEQAAEQCRAMNCAGETPLRRASQGGIEDV